MTVGHGEKLTRKQEQAIAALLGHSTIGEAARAAGVSESTLLRWVQRADFQAAYREARRQAVGQAIARLQQASSAAVNTLQAVMADAEAPAAAKVSAAKTILELAIKAVEIEDLASRIEALERSAAAVASAERQRNGGANGNARAAHATP